MSASRSAANSPLRCSSHRSAASPSSPDDRQLARARLFLRRKRRTPTGPSSAPSPQQIALNDPLEASRAATAASLSSDRFRHRESISSCLPFSTVTQPALVLFPNQIRIYSQQAPSKIYSASALPPVIDGSYPVDPETAAAVEAASRHQVGSFPNEETVDWVFRHFVSQGKTPLPDDIDGGDEKVLRSWFRDSNSLEDFRSGRDFQYGLCDVCDRDVERACQSVYQSFRRLIDHGEIRSGAHVRFRGTLIRFFEDVPLLDQQWIDAYTVVLAE